MFVIDDETNNFSLTELGFTPYQILVAFFNAGEPFGNSRIAYNKDDTMSLQEAEVLYEQSPERSFGFIKGRCLKIRFENGRLIAFNHDRVYGAGHAKKILDGIKAAK